MSEELMYYYKKVRPIVLKLHREYVLKYWELSDWEQEGCMVLYQLLLSHSELKSNTSKLRIYFKTKFSNYIKDKLRRQESYKRRFDKMVYEDIWEQSHRIGSRGLVQDNRIALEELLSNYQSHLSEAEQEKYDRLLGGESFRGRKAMVRELRIYLKDFEPDLYQL